MRFVQVTITGIDARTDLARVQDLSNEYDVEWAVLFSPERQGHQNRFPALEDIEDFLHLVDSRKAAHLCGQHARVVMSGCDPGVDLRGFQRVQVNHRDPDPDRVAAYAKGHGMQGIMQVRDLEFPCVRNVQMLFDRSGGAGRQPAGWPLHPGWLVGYAGGISPETIETTLARIDSSGPCWLDMENGVRTDDWLDLDKVEAVLEAVHKWRRS